MKTVFILSDTHGFLHPRFKEAINECDEVWHAGDIGRLDILESLENNKTVTAVYGNIDNYEIRNAIPEFQYFDFHGNTILIIHIGGYPGRYSKNAYQLIKRYKPNIFVTGHSHILKVMHDKQNDLLYINPGAAGKFGSHKVITAVKLNFKENKVTDLQVLELKK